MCSFSLSLHCYEMNEENGSTNEREKRKHIILPLFLVKRRKRERSERMMNDGPCDSKVIGVSMSIFWTQNRALKTTILARYLVGPGGSSSSRWWDQIGLGGTRWVLSSLWAQIGFDGRGSQPFSRGTLHSVWVLQCKLESDGCGP